MIDFVNIDGKQFQPISKAPQIDIQTAEEGEFIFDKENNLYATVRLEGSGALVCRADKDSLYKWNFKRYKYKFDSLNFQSPIADQHLKRYIGWVLGHLDECQIKVVVDNGVVVGKQIQ